MANEVISFHYSAVAEHGDAYAPAASNQYEFETVGYKRPKVITARIEGVLLNGNRYSHVDTQTNRHIAVISANELTETHIAFFEAYWGAERRYISVYSGAAWGTYMEVLTEGEEFPLESLEDIEALPEIEISMIEAR